MKTYDITFQKIEDARQECMKKKAIPSNPHLAKSIRMWIASYNKVKSNFVATQLYHFLEDCRVK